MNKELIKYITKLSKNDKKTLSQKCGKVTEENGELAGKVLAYENASGFQDKIVGKKSILEESVDVLLSAISIPLAEGFTIEDISDMIYEKCLHWEEKQIKEEKVDFPIWFESHVTIDRPDDIEQYIKDCKEIGVKPIVLDLQNGSDVVMQDVMTSSKHLGDNQSAMDETTNISNFLKSKGYNVVREKIESVPFHPSAPRDFDKKPKMPKDCYFESHIGIKINDESELETLKRVADKNDCHLSKNFFKKNEDGSYVIMMTYRNYKDTLERFQYDVETLKHILDHEMFKYEKVIVEFSVYDSKVSHDSEWLKDKQR
jgi:NTP pyrophosphatase (non-canonical NTP hydrolase)